MVTTQVSINEYRKMRFNKGSAPDPRTVRKWIINGDIIGGRRANGKFYVEINQYGKEVSFDEYELMNHG